MKSVVINKENIEEFCRKLESDAEERFKKANTNVQKVDIGVMEFIRVIKDFVMASVEVAAHKNRLIDFAKECASAANENDKLAAETLVDVVEFLTNVRNNNNNSCVEFSAARSAYSAIRNACRTIGFDTNEDSRTTGMYVVSKTRNNDPSFARLLIVALLLAEDTLSK